MSHLGELYKHIFSPSTYLLHHYVIKLGVLTEEIKKKKITLAKQCIYRFLKNFK